MLLRSRSIRARLLLWLGSLLTAILVGFGWTAYQLNRAGQLAEIDEALQRRVAALQADVRGGPPPGRGFPSEPPSRGPGDPGGPPRPPPPRPRGAGDLFNPSFSAGPDERPVQLSDPTASLFLPADPNGYYFVIWSPNGALQSASPHAPADTPAPPVDAIGGRTYTRMRGEWREVYYFTERRHAVLAGISIREHQAASRRFAGWLVAAGAVVLGIGVGGGGVIVTRSLRPIDAIGAAASRIAQGDLAERIDVSDIDSELGRLAQVLNSTFARLDAAFSEQKQFTADASHELRTPLAVIISEAQTTLARERSAAEYRETIETCLHTAQQMRRLTESLLVLARFDSGHAAIQRSACNLADLAHACVTLVRPLAEARHLRVALELSPAPLVADPDRIAQVITNLLTNAIHYNREGGDVRVVTASDAAQALLHVSDTGPGIAAEDVPHIFERFYRADKSRSRAEGRSGLGLAICRAITDAHGGTITVVSRIGEGTTFTLRLPRGAG